MSELLLIDDDQELCELLISWLAQEGFVAHACHDGQSAKQALAQYQPAAVVLDVMLPDGSGVDWGAGVVCRSAMAIGSILASPAFARNGRPDTVRLFTPSQSLMAVCVFEARSVTLTLFTFDQFGSTMFLTMKTARDSGLRAATFAVERAWKGFTKKTEPFATFAGGSVLL